MDLGLYIACVTAVSLLQGVYAGCVQDISTNQEFTQCIMGYSMYMSNAASSMDPNDPKAMMSVMCSKEGKAAMQCVLGFIKSCPDLMTSGDTSTMLQGFMEFENYGGFDAYCNMAEGPCQAVQQCLVGQDFGGDQMPSYPTPFSVLQDNIKMVCGPVKGMFECFKDAGNKCKQLEDNIKTAMDMGRSEAPPGTTLPTFDKTKMFVKQECQKLPQDFGTSTCVKNTLTSNTFVKCYENVSVTYPTQNDQISCDAYRAGHKCVSMSVGKSCGEKYTEAFVKITPMFMAGVPSGCKLESSDTSGSPSLVQMSAASILVAFILAFKLK